MKHTNGAGDVVTVDPPPPRLPPTRPAPPPAPDSQLVGGLTLFLAVGMVGVALMLGGLAWDGWRHARHPETAHLERSVFMLSNPSHFLLLLGGGLAVASLTTATARALSVSPSRRLASKTTRVSLVVATLVMALVTAGTLRWAAEAEVPVASGPLAPGPAPDKHRIGVINSHDPGECRPTKAQIAAAEKLIADTKAGTARYAESMYAAMADGYVGPATPATTDHYSNGAYSGDGRVLDPTRPESLMYTLTSHGPVLVGVMYLMNVPGEFGPEVGGCLTRWHVHTNVCLSTTTFQPVQEMVDGQACPVGTFHFIPPPALHVWLIDVPGGRFAPDLDEDYLIRTVGP